jgi:anti-anti-sigma regulatory factor
LIDSRPLDARTLLVVVDGATDRIDALRVQRVIFSAVRRGQVCAIIDLTALEGVQPGLLGVLLRARRQLLAIGGTLAVVTSTTAAALFGVAGADDLLARAATVDEARLAAAGATAEAEESIEEV